MATTAKQDPPAGPAAPRRPCWILRAAVEAKLGKLSADPVAGDLPKALVHILSARLEEGVDIQRFLEPLLQNLSDPFDLPDMAPAVDRILAAIEAEEKVTLFGDYDVDGVTAVALMAEVLAAYGVEAACTLPRRQSEGYGLTDAGVTRCLEENPETGLLMALDCGTNARDQAAALAARGVDLVVLDHHETSAEQLADCVAVVNPKRPDGGDHCYLSTVGIVFKVAHALLRARPLDAEKYDLRDGLDLVALGTVADVVPLVGENRILVKRGLDRMEKTRRPGILALRQVAGIRPDALLKAGTIGFVLGPRINAAGRLGVATDALELVCADDPLRAGELAEALDRLNRERRQVEEEIFAEAEEMAAKQLACSDNPALVLGGKGWHAGVAGIVAARIARIFHRPTVVVGFDEEGLGKGSGRSVAGFDLVAALDASRDLLEAGGGHEQAVGLTVRSERFAEFRDTFVAAVAAVITPEELEPKLFIDAEVGLGEMNFPFLEALARLEPFGNSNPEPLFVARGVRPAGEPRWLKEKHLKLRVVQDGATHEAIYFNCPVDLPPSPWDIAFVPGENHYNGRTTIQLVLRGIRAAGEMPEVFSGDHRFR